MSVLEYLQESLNNVWYHGTPDSREVDKSGFSTRSSTTTEITDPEKFNQIQQKLSTMSSDDDEYHEVLKMVSGLKAQYKYPTPIFLSNKRSVAGSYADDSRAYDYQNSTPKVYAVDVRDGKKVTIVATGDKFSHINVDKVRKGFTQSGVSDKDFDNALSKFNFADRSKGIKTDMIATIAHYLGFDTIDVVGVLDSYSGGSEKSTVKMVLNPKNISIANKGNK